ncbi:Na+-transporting NADH:ubiquinone oxidoreductase subunit C [Devosia subaequoris]|uniref:Na(+)-translocating NADH-quinone reductase subunit C n=1 Tax=Devosia subaequoris TaxID=395930 RepID=A0A7W6NBW6_9HYPH|nr:NADH:ubiquinone reductase (Na(+)-transporting) subunit C [Devosia subaequoris]MBB4052139.1 Na+-transporting NADH:ubiquinone oxidoreductase subunit C [Devosia subaequoris]MCP1209304.1 NADH:ubiquinone reductase (Na(+)-transporting) subunit C [Devosia subaequoris]
MPDLNPLYWWARLLALPNESRAKTIAMAFLVSGVCALLVSSAVVLLAPIQNANLAAEREARLSAMLENMPGLADIIAQYGADSLETVIVDLETGEATDIDPATFDIAVAAEDPDTSSVLPSEVDIAGLGRRADLAPIHVLRANGELRLVILPISAVGYQSTIRAHVALEADLNTVAGLSIIEHGETPGLGARIEEPAWQALWPGKELAGEDGQIRLSVVRGRATSAFEVDGITGATRTGNAITAAIHFWLGEYGFDDVLANLRRERGQQ